MIMIIIHCCCCCCLRNEMVMMGEVKTRAKGKSACLFAYREEGRWMTRKSDPLTRTTPIGGRFVSVTDFDSMTRMWAVSCEMWDMSHKLWDEVWLSRCYRISFWFWISKQRINVTMRGSWDDHDDETIKPWTLASLYIKRTSEAHNNYNSLERSSLRRKPPTTQSTGRWTDTLQVSI